MKEIEILKNLAESPLIHTDVKSAVEKAISAMTLLEGLRIYMGADFPKAESLSKNAAQADSTATSAARPTPKAESSSKAAQKPAATDSKPSTGAGARWTAEEDERLTQEFKSGLRATELATLHGRSVPSVLIRLCDKLQLISEDQKKELLSKFYSRNQGQDSSATPAKAESNPGSESAQGVQDSTQQGSQSPNRILSPQEVEDRMPEFIQNAH